LQWLLDWQPKGDAWSTRSVESSYEDANPARASLVGFSRLFEHLGVEHRVLSPELIEQGVLRHGYRLLVLPRVLSLSRRAAAEIERFVARGGVLVADGTPGVFDAHGRRLPEPRLAAVLGSAPSGSASFGKGRAFQLSPAGEDRATFAEMTRVLAAAHVEPRFALTDAAGAPVTDVEINQFRVGRRIVVGLQRDLPADGGGIEPGAVEAVTLRLARPAFVYDLRARKAVGEQQRMALSLGPVEPVLLSLGDGPVPPPRITAPQHARPGDTVSLRLAPAARQRLAVLHLEVIDPDGGIRQSYSGNAVVRAGGTTRVLPLALNDPDGLWEVRATDLVTGETASAALRVDGP
ncbi:MAG TPA: beta-galactosidase trimerization domain-containing protein, partial [Stellaceae bacterium]|nr:beta-galactosidase trimerization domain-containing protein [Stellaceae bacterium]